VVAFHHIGFRGKGKALLDSQKETSLVGDTTSSHFTQKKEAESAVVKSNGQEGESPSGLAESRRSLERKN